jgi:hypothetical protein
MTQIEQRIAIATHLGWIGIERKPRHHQEDWVIGYPPGATDRGDFNVVPNYPHDLNAMRKAEDTLTERQQRRYVEILTLRASVTDSEITSRNAWIAIHATAAQRAEAFLRTLNLWKD